MGAERSAGGRDGEMGRRLAATIVYRRWRVLRRGRREVDHGASLFVLLLLSWRDPLPLLLCCFLKERPNGARLFARGAVFDL